MNGVCQPFLVKINISILISQLVIYLFKLSEKYDEDLKKSNTCRSYAFLTSLFSITYWESKWKN